MHRPIFFACLYAATLVMTVGAAVDAKADEGVAEIARNEPYRVVSYNIKRGFGNDRVTDLKRTADVIRRLRPDFVGLQEVDEKVRRSGKVDQAVELSKQLKMFQAFAPFMDYDGGRYGLAVLSRYPIENVTVVKLPEGNEPRVALAAEVSLPDGSKLMLVNLHFDWVKDDSFRFEQASTLKKFLDKLSMPYILLGDFNDVPDSRTLKLFRQGTIEAAKPTANRMTIPSDNPTKEIDFIFASPPSLWKIGEVAVIDEKVASDHCPVVAEMLLAK